LQLLVCTSTLAWGVNLPAHLVVIKGTEYYDAKSKRYVDFPITDILQMMGRAGRPQYDQHGKAVILVHEPKKSFYKKFLYEPFPVESSLREQLHDHINAEIVSGTICHKEDAVHYLTWTYLFRRLVVNPAYYGLEHTDPENISSYLSSLSINVFEDLEDGGCIKVDGDGVEPTMLGSIASLYYLKYTTLSMFASKIEANTSLEGFLQILSEASEYDELPVRHNEENYNAELSAKLPYAVDKNLLDDPHVKANLLFQAHFSRVELPITDYVTDLKSVLDQSVRIIQAMIDLCANSGWLSSTLTCMRLLQMVMQGLWYDGNDSSLRMLTCLNKDISSKLNQRGVSTILQLLDLHPATAEKLFGVGSRLQEEVQRFPSIEVQSRVEKQNEGDDLRVWISLKNVNGSKRASGSKAYTPRYPKVKEEGWWLVVGNRRSSELYAFKRVSFRDVARVKMDVRIPSNHAHQAKLKIEDAELVVVSDCYLGYELAYPL
ncbi:hypothetical protein M569_05199, partial [Genlisea aurea]